MFMFIGIGLAVLSQIVFRFINWEKLGIYDSEVIHGIESFIFFTPLCLTAAIQFYITHASILFYSVVVFIQFSVTIRLIIKVKEYLKYKDEYTKLGKNSIRGYSRWIRKERLKK